ncbi:MAG TPA: DUF4876 domain-containing protein, partial [Calditrichaeota bacterium]|nr:DUF4876 domain-containing protein [Calditrichota bacterium]
MVFTIHVIRKYSGEWLLALFWIIFFNLRPIFMKYPIILLIVLFLSCAREMPVHIDGTLSYRASVYYVDTTFTEQDRLIPVSEAKVTMISVNYTGADDNPKTYTQLTDTAGMAIFENLAVGQYNIFVSKEIITNTKTILITGSKILMLPDSLSGIDSIRVQPIEKSNIVINEIYYCGPPNRSFYFYDQFVELYNNSDRTVYLDGMFICRTVQKRHPDIETNDFVQTLNIFKFPGEPLTGMSYPLEAGEFVVVAQDAIDHSQFVEKAVDLSGAAWEFYNPYSGDIDNPAPNVENFLPEKTNDFMINLVHNGVILSDGSDWYWGETSESGYQYIHIPIETV